MAAHEQPVADAIVAIKKALPTGTLLQLGSPEYEEHRRNHPYYSARLNELKPAAIVKPANTADVAAAIKALQPYVKDGVQVAIRGAGQQPTPNCSNVDGGITLDLVQLQGIDIDEDAKVVRLGAGARWKDVYEAVQAKGLGVTGSRSADGGVGGLALAGGLSFFGSREGFIADNVTNYQVVLASGEVVDANSEKNLELWRALRGGGNNFGIVTRFDLRTFPQEPFWGGKVFYLADKFPAQIDALVKELKNPNASVETHLMQTIGFAAEFQMEFCMNQLYYTKNVENPPELQPFLDIQPELMPSTFKISTLLEAAREQAGDSRPDKRTSYFNCTVQADAATLKSAAAIFSKQIEPLKPLPGIVAGFTLQSYPTSLLQKSSELGGNSLGLSPSNGPLVSILLLNFWERREDDDLVISTIECTLQMIKADAAERGTLHPYTYLNYSWDSLDPIRSYGEQNVEQLRMVARKYDATGFFQKGVPGGFKLFD